jgi:hypothetical protein
LDGAGLGQQRLPGQRRELPLILQLVQLRLRGGLATLAIEQLGVARCRAEDPLPRGLLVISQPLRALLAHDRALLLGDPLQFGG